MKSKHNIEITLILKQTSDALTSFDQYTQDKLISILQSKKDDPKQQEEMEYEIIVGSLLLNAGFKVEHEKIIINDKTPDWFIHKGTDHPEFIVEVGVLNSEKIVEKLETRIEEMKSEINKLTFNADILLDFNHIIDSQYVTEFINIKNIVDDLKVWLSNNPSDEITTEGVIVKYRGKTNGGITLRTDTSHSRRWRDERFILKVEEKKCAYFSEILKMKLPYIIIVISDFNSGTTLSRINDILTGTNNTSTRQRIIGNWMPTISGILVIEPLSSWKAQYFDNSEAAIYKLDNQIMDDVINLVFNIKN